MIIDVHGLVQFRGNGDVWLTPAGVEAAVTDPERLIRSLVFARDHRRDRVLQNAENGRGPLGVYEGDDPDGTGILDAFQYAEALQDIGAESIEAARRAGSGP